jgi:hypothetical protein
MVGEKNEFEIACSIALVMREMDKKEEEKKMHGVGSNRT